MLDLGYPVGRHLLIEEVRGQRYRLVLIDQAEGAQQGEAGCQYPRDWGREGSRVLDIAPGPLDDIYMVAELRDGSAAIAVRKRKEVREKGVGRVGIPFRRIGEVENAVITDSKTPIAQKATSKAVQG